MMNIDSGTEEQRGTKRKAEAATPGAPKRIKPLDQNVVNKIAAGEIIVAPMHALKEMIENSVDAGATWIEVVVKDGGMKLLQISDNGHGIHVEDLPILCERFTTSKLKSFEDLSSIATYGFRGEALASISHIAHLRITTKTNESSCAFQAHYRDGKLVPKKSGGDAKPKPVAGRTGTQITVEDLFYNVPQRQKAFRSYSEEYAKILDVVGRYSIHCHGVAFSCKKQADNSPGLSTGIHATVTERIGSVYGQSLAKELVSFAANDARLGFSALGYASNANYHTKKTSMLLFVNNRAVESTLFRTAIQRTYTVFLPKGSFPFCYLDIKISPERVDVNIHPTKREVGLLNEEEIVDAVCSSLREALLQTDKSRTFLTQSTLSLGNVVQTPKPQATMHSISSNVSQRQADNNIVRTDPRARKITTMMDIRTGPTHDFRYRTADKTPVQIKLTSVRELRASVRAQLHQGLSEIFDSHTWIGVVDMSHRVAAIQSGVRLFLVDYGMLANEFFYQLGLTSFGNFGSIQFEQPLDIRVLVKMAAEKEQAAKPELNLESAPDKIVRQLVERRAMLLEYFNMEISEDGQLLSMPLLLRNYVPCFAKLPFFLLRIGPCVDWGRERECFQSFLSELASFYSPERLPRESADSARVREGQEIDVSKRRAEILHSLEHNLFPAFRDKLVATKGLLSGIIEIADLKGLYRVFERC